MGKSSLDDKVVGLHAPRSGVTPKHTTKRLSALQGAKWVPPSLREEPGVKAVVVIGLRRRPRFRRRLFSGYHDMLK